MNLPGGEHKCILCLTHSKKDVQKGKNCSKNQTWTFARVVSCSLLHASKLVDRFGIQLKRGYGGY